MTELAQKVAERYAVSALVDQEAPTSPDIVRQTNSMFADIQSGVVRHMRGLDQAMSAERQALQELLRSIHSWQSRSASTVGAERDLQVQLMATLNHLDPERINAADVANDAKTIDPLV